MKFCLRLFQVYLFSNREKEDVFFVAYALSFSEKIYVVVTVFRKTGVNGAIQSYSACSEEELPAPFSGNYSKTKRIAVLIRVLRQHQK